MKTEKIVVIGEGSWGTAIASVLAHNGHAVTIWCHDEAVVDQINNEHRNTRYMPDIELASTISASPDIGSVVRDATVLFWAIPVKYLRSVVQEAAPHANAQQIWVILSKGIEKESLLLPSQIVDDSVNFEVKKAVFSGPSFAYEVIRKQPTAGSLAVHHSEVAQQVQAIMENEYFKPHVTTDVVGIQIGGAVKNVFTLGMGILQGAGYGDNTQAFLLTESLAEMALLADFLGGKRETVYGLSGVGDLVLTSMGQYSKNQEVGRRLGGGGTLETILDKTGYIPEGINTVASLFQLAEKEGIALPICTGIYDMIFNNKPVYAFLADMMKR